LLDALPPSTLRERERLTTECLIHISLNEQRNYCRGGGRELFVKRINTLDGWRAIAILMVTINHAAESIWEGRSDILDFTRAGSVGVDVFFALSGLLITRLLLEEQDCTGKISLKSFYVRRCFRVVLPCYCYLAVICLFSAIHNRTELLSGVFFFRNYLNPSDGSFYTAHLWSLAVEEHFYLIWPIALVLGTVRYGQQLAMWGAVACGLWRTVSFHYAPMLLGNVVYLWRTDYRLDSLLWGCAFGFVLHKSETLKRIIPVAVVYVICVGSNSPTNRLLMPILFPLVIIITATHADWMVSKLLDSPPMRWIGKVSYSLYLWQMVFLVRTSHSEFWWQRFPANIVMAFVTAAVCYYCIDLPLQGLGHRLAKRVEADKNKQILCSDVAASGYAAAGP
jgi:peptidoglycan/LPS O-acetylase OafA/YrhL